MCRVLRLLVLSLRQLLFVSSPGSALCLSVASMGIFATESAPAAKLAPPNIVSILADDLGYNQMTQLLSNILLKRRDDILVLLLTLLLLLPFYVAYRMKKLRPF